MKCLYTKAFLIMSNKLIILNIIIIPLIAGCGFLINKQTVNGDSQKYYIGSANTTNYQTVIKDILLKYGYHVDEYEQDAYSSNMITKWNVREPFPAEEDLGHLDAKTRIMINGLVINNSYSRNGGFSYECYLRYSNLVFNGSEYVEFYNSPILLNNIESMVEEIRKALLLDDNDMMP
tara:strand:- start:142 stop:672 length:531 start_codon:yes stop_codon:yes gene_type:complete